MILFGLGYGASIWLAFLVFVLCELPRHPDPVPFAQMFLLLHPLWITALGLEPLVAIPKERRSMFHRLVQQGIISQSSVIRTGLYTGLLASIAAAVFGILAYFVSPWFAIGALPVLLFAPVIGFTRFWSDLSPDAATSPSRGSDTAAF